jgi:hypothetical protein
VSSCCASAPPTHQPRSEAVRNLMTISVSGVNRHCAAAVRLFSADHIASSQRREATHCRCTQKCTASPTRRASSGRHHRRAVSSRCVKEAAPLFPSAVAWCRQIFGTTRDDVPVRRSPRLPGRRGIGVIPVMHALLRDLSPHRQRGAHAWRTAGLITCRWW